MGKGKTWHLLLFSGSDRKKCLSVLNYAKAMFNDETHTEEDICRIVNDSEKSGNVRGFLSFTDKNDFFERASALFLYEAKKHIMPIHNTPNM